MYFKETLHYSCIIAIFVISASAVASVNVERLAELGKCYKDFNAISKDVSLFNREETQCFVNCILNFWNVVDSNGVLNKDGILRKVHRLFPGETSVPAVIEKCSTTRGHSPCNTATLTYDCLEKNVQCTNFVNCLSDLVLTDTP